MVSSGGKEALKSHPFLAPDSVQKLTSQAYRKLKDHVPALKQSFSLYIANADTENILITPVKVSADVNSFHSKVRFISINAPPIL